MEQAAGGSWGGRGARAGDAVAAASTRAAGRGWVPLPGHLCVRDRSTRACGQGRWQRQSSTAVCALGTGEGGERQERVAEGARCTGGLWTEPHWVFLPGPPLPLAACAHRDALRLFLCQRWLGFLLESKQRVPVVRAPCQILFHARKEEKLPMINCAVGENMHLSNLLHAGRWPFVPALPRRAAGEAAARVRGQEGADTSAAS